MQSNPCIGHCGKHAGRHLLLWQIKPGSKYINNFYVYIAQLYETTTSLLQLTVIPGLWVTIIA